MIDSQDLDAFGVIVDRGEDPVRASSRARETFDFWLKWLANATGCIHQVAEGKLDDRGDDARLDTLKVTPCRCYQNSFITHGLGSVLKTAENSIRFRRR